MSALDFMRGYLNWKIFPLVLAVSGLYFFSSPKNQPMGARLLASVHGLSIALLYIAGLLIAWNGPSVVSCLIFIVLTAIIVALIIISFFYFQGTKSTHILQVINVLCLIWIIFETALSLSGDTL
jgi:heme/copper-type cytochrome/quinol oxidase subunit 4